MATATSNGKRRAVVRHDRQTVRMIEDRVEAARERVEGGDVTQDALAIEIGRELNIVVKASHVQSASAAMGVEWRRGGTGRKAEDACELAAEVCRLRVSNAELAALVSKLADELGSAPIAKRAMELAAEIKGDVA